MVDIPPEDDEHITDWIWRLHGEGRLLDAVDGSVLVAAGGGGDQQDDRVADEARRLLLLGLACTDPNPLDRPSMAEVLQVITKVMPPPDVPPKKPAFVWPPRDWRSRNSVYSTALSDWDRDLDGSLASTAELAQVSMEQPSTTVAGGHASVRSRSTQRLHGGTEQTQPMKDEPNLPLCSWPRS
ncbi:unnamed protein product [Miscanthus lutarioriparius]|uniref:Uncharacterized protein n=1 Tax=Miscanthus lutarioriparius TaxID=422564 RepID=A0A811QHJ6_9POAL|nr:unnamed protein product [Miscanthus lutarioriparius]